MLLLRLATAAVALPLWFSAGQLAGARARVAFTDNARAFLLMMYVFWLNLDRQ